MKRREAVGGLLGTSFVLSGCETLDSLDTSAAAEGTGIQFTGLIKVLAKYPSTPNQKAVAKRKGEEVYVKKALAPAYKARKQQIETTMQAKIKKVSPKSSPSTPTASAADQAIDKIKKDTAVQIAALDTAWERTTTASKPAGTFRPPVDVSSTVALASVSSESNALRSEASKYIVQNIAVSVPKVNVVSVEKSAADSVMFYNTRTQSLAKNEVYVIDKKPKANQVTSFDDVKALYGG